MATEGGQLRVTGLVAGADLSLGQYHFVELSAANTVTIANAITDNVIGVLQNNPTSGQSAEVVAFGRSKVSADAAIAVGAQISTSVDGQAQTAVGTQHVCGMALEAASAAGEIVSMFVNIAHTIKA